MVLVPSDAKTSSDDRRVTLILGQTPWHVCWQQSTLQTIIYWTVASGSEL